MQMCISSSEHHPTLLSQGHTEWSKGPRSVSAERKSQPYISPENPSLSSSFNCSISIPSLDGSGNSASRWAGPELK